MSLTLSVTDLANGTGATAAVAGSGGASVSVYTQAVSAGGNGAWALSATRTGDGAVTLALAAGFYWVYATTGSAPSNLAYAAVTDAAESVDYRCLLAVQATVRALNLTGITADRVLIQPSPNDRVTKLPAVLVAPGDREEADDAFDTEYDAVTYPCLVRVAYRADSEDAGPLAQVLARRQAIRRAFRNQPMPAVAEVYKVTVRDGRTLAYHAKGYQVLSSDLTVLCMAAELRP